METRIAEIADGIYRLSTFVPDIAPPAGFTFNQFLVLGDEPLAVTEIRPNDGFYDYRAKYTEGFATHLVPAPLSPDLYEQVAPRPASPWAQALRLALIDAAPEAAQEPMVVVLSPGIHSETAFDQAYLASVLGFPLVESADLVVRDGKLWMRSLGTLKRVDVVLRRVDAEYVDPLDLRPDSRLGVVGLVEVLRRGAVTVVNTLGSGILESPGIMRFLPELARLLTGEDLELAGARCFWGGLDAERSHLVSKLSTLLIRPVTGGPTIVGPALSAAQRAELAARIEATGWQWVGQELPTFSSAPMDVLPSGLSAGSVGLRLFTVAQRSGYAPMIGGLGYILARGHAAYSMKTVAAKDVWVRTPDRSTAVPIAPVDLPAITPSPTRAVSSPRVLSDLFWLGRYAERAEFSARLLTVTRERYHEYRYRPDVPGSECVPVLLTALGEITGSDTGGDGDHTEQVATTPTTLWALTAAWPGEARLLPAVVHVLTHLDWTLQPCHWRLPDDLGSPQRLAIEAALPPGRWVPRSEALALGLPAPIRRWLEAGPPA